MNVLLLAGGRVRNQLNVPKKPTTRKNSFPAEYANILPPSQRFVLGQLWTTYKEAPASSEVLSSLLSIGSDYQLADGSKFVYSGFSVSEIRALGDFPDYAKLSGVPLPTPVPDFKVDAAFPRPYRPFRWNYHQTMDYWLELESTYRQRVLQRQELYAKHGQDVLRALPGSELACKELMEMVLQFLCTRYPHLFQVKDKRTLVNNILGTTHDLTKSEPLHVLLNNVPEDFALVLRDEKTGRYVFRAGIICSSVGWHLGHKIGLDMASIHAPVPDFKEKLAFSLDRFFTKMQTSQPIQRGSWGLEVGQPLFLPAEHPQFVHRNNQNANLRAEDINLRVDWQTLRRLPLSGAIVFNFRALFTPLPEFRDEPYVPSLLLKILDEGKRNLMDYKGTWHVEHIAKPALHEYEKFQVSQGLVEPEWEPRTLDETPFYPGWKEKWTTTGLVDTRRCKS
ncbi:Protein of unknown function (DUF3445) [Geosmithia morbida]|uniref:Alpha-1,2-mannosyltransferase n=1 Tax=Geosmithia morbida TaxID=1094350 RepID=A0A9P4Z2H2_9HYPO|nr:Protein of unknown function (DUF3445) [Geosmithia morbida]KAF4126251.1 Protein of unknown function (DUF3445) [Geosmithia morbida]